MTNFSPEDYDRWYKSPLGSLCDRLEKEAIFRLFKPKGIILDVGCGTGNYTLELERQGIKTVGIDLSFEMAAFAKKKGETQGLRANFVVGRAEELPFKNNTFDGIIGVTALCFASNPENMIAEMKRVMKSGVDIVLGELNRLSYWAFLRRLKGLFKKSVYREARFYSIKALMRMLQDAGFKDTKWSSCLYFPPINSLWFLKFWKIFEEAGKTLYPKSGAFIVITGRKVEAHYG